MMVSLSPQVIALSATGQSAGRPADPDAESGFDVMLETEDLPDDSEADPAPVLWGALVLPLVHHRPAMGDRDGEPATRLPPQFMAAAGMGAAPVEPDAVVASAPMKEPDPPTPDAADAPFVFPNAAPVVQSADRPSAPDSGKAATRSDGPEPAKKMIESDKPTEQIFALAGAVIGSPGQADRVVAVNEQVMPAFTLVGSKEAAARLRATDGVAVDAVTTPHPEPETDPPPPVRVDLITVTASNGSQDAARGSNLMKLARIQEPRMLRSEYPKETPVSPHSPMAQLMILVAAEGIPQTGTWQPTLTHPLVAPAVQVPMLPAALPPDLPLVLLAQAAKAAESPIELLLNPEELGRLRFEMIQDGDQMKVVLSAEHPETLDLIRKNADQLLNEFKQAGFSNASLSFGQWSQGSSNPSKSLTVQGRFDQDGEVIDVSQEPARHPHRSAGQSSASGLDLRL